MYELTDLIDDLRALTLAQLMAASRQERARLALECRGLEARLKDLVEQFGEEARWEVVAYESWTTPASTCSSQAAGATMRAV